MPLDLHQSVMVDDDFEIKPYYAGHVLGAAMFYIRVGNQSVVYTGDYNMTPDRHLGKVLSVICFNSLHYIFFSIEIYSIVISRMTSITQISTCLTYRCRLDRQV